MVKPSFTSTKDGRPLFVRKATTADHTAVSIIDGKAYEIPWEPDQWYGHLKHAYIATLGPLIVGYIVTVEKTDDDGKKVQVILRLAVHHEFQRNGIGTALLNVAIDLAGDSEIRMTLRESQQPGWYFLRHHKFLAKPLGPYFAAPWQKNKENGYRFTRTKPCRAASPSTPVLT